MRACGVDSIFHAGRKLGDDPNVIPAWPPIAGRVASHLVAWIGAQRLRAYPDRGDGTFSVVDVSYGCPRAQLVSDADVICLHWIAGSFLRPAQLVRLQKPLVWRLSDLWPFTGGCHYSAGCRAFEHHCGRCPALGSHDADDLAARGFAARNQAYPALDLTIVAPSRWIAEQARRSALFGHRRIEHIATGIDVTLYRPLAQAEARARVGLPCDERPIILFGAMAAIADSRKGYQHMQEALRLFAASAAAQGALAVIFGGEKQPDGEVASMKIHHIGRIDDESRLAALYAAADMFVAPFEEDNLPNVILESLAAGTPVVAFAAGGIPDAVDHQVNGCLARVGSVDELARGMAWVLTDPSRKTQLRGAARATAEARFDIRECARRYRQLFAELAGRQDSPEV